LLQHVESAASALGNVSSVLVFSKPQLVSWSGMSKWLQSSHQERGPR
jgi:hypothetical protein